MNRVFIDMDGVLADFETGAKKWAEAHGYGPEVSLKKERGLYATLPPIPGAISGVRSIIGMGFDVWIATKPPTGISSAYQEKAQWVFDNIPELTRKVIITPDKGMLGEAGDVLIDDRMHKANCCEFRGMKWDFTGGAADWDRVVKWLRGFKPAKRGRSWPL